MRRKFYSAKKVGKPLVVFLYLLTSLIFIVLNLSFRNLNFNEWSRVFVGLIVAQFVFQYFCLRLSKVKMFTLVGHFLILSYLFHFGQLLIMVIFPKYAFARFNYYAFYDWHGLKLASEYGLIAILMVGLGIVLSTRWRQPSKTGKQFSESKSRTIGWILVLLTFPIQLYLDLANLQVSIVSGYTATYQSTVAGAWPAIGAISFTGFSLLVLGYTGQKKKSSAILFFVFSYLVLTMFTGSRGHQLTRIVFYVYLFHRTVRKIQFKDLLVVGGIAFVGFGLLDTIAMFRQTQGKTLMDFMDLFLRSANGDAIKNMIVELGGTIKTLYLAVEQVPRDMPHALGTTYLASLATIVPNVGGVFSSLNSSAIFQKSLEGSSLGGSYIAELYYNFSYFGLLMAPLIGMFINRVSQKIEVIIDRQDYFLMAYYAPLYMSILWWTRDAFNSLIRPFVWGAFAVFVCENVVRRRLQKDRHGQLSEQGTRLIVKESRGEN